MKKLISVLVVLLFVTIALGERRTPDRNSSRRQDTSQTTDQCRDYSRLALSVDYFELYLEEHPDLTQRQREVILCFLALYELMPYSQEEDQEWMVPMSDILYKEGNDAFGIITFKKIFIGLDEYTNNG